MVIYYLISTGLCGGVKVVCEHVSRLAAAGVRAEIWSTDQPPTWFKGRFVPFRHFATLGALGAEARKTRADKVATFWSTAAWVNETIQQSDRGFYLVQDLDGDTYGGDHDGNSYRLGLQPITEGQWVTKQLRDSWGLSPVNVGIALDHDVFRPLPALRDRNRVFTSYRPGHNDLKGWHTVTATMAELVKLNPSASLVTYGMAGKPTVTSVPHIHVHGPSDAKLRALYCEAGVYLMPSRHEGFCLPALEAMACECPVVCTDADGNREYSVHGLNCLMSNEPANLAEYIHRLQTDHDYADRLGKAGRETALMYQWEPVITRLAELFTGRNRDAKATLAACDAVDAHRPAHGVGIGCTQASSGLQRRAD